VNGALHVGSVMSDVWCSSLGGGSSYKVEPIRKVHLTRKLSSFVPNDENRVSETVCISNIPKNGRCSV
jgi:hypothetical protein